MSATPSGDPGKDNPLNPPKQQTMIYICGGEIYHYSAKVGFGLPFLLDFLNINYNAY